MFRKSILIALAAAATFGTAVISADAASAAVGARNNVGRTSHVSRVNISRVNIRTPNRPGVHVHPRLPHWHVWRHYRRPIVIGTTPLVVGAVSPAVIPAGRCTCLTKEYTPEGAVLFKDVCTNEAAMNPPAVAPAPTAEVQPQK